jgi:hypothetical protein
LNADDADWIDEEGFRVELLDTYKYLEILFNPLHLGLHPRSKNLSIPLSIPLHIVARNAPRSYWFG